MAECRVKKRASTCTTRDKTKHRLFEQGRRQAFNELLVELSTVLPNLQDIERSQTSKHTIVEESLKYHQSQQTEIDALQRRVAHLMKERLELLEEVNAFRQCLELDLRQAWDEPNLEPSAERSLQAPTEPNALTSGSERAQLADTNAMPQSGANEATIPDASDRMFHSELPRLLESFTGDPLPTSSTQPFPQLHNGLPAKRLTEYRTWTAYPADYGGAGSVQKEVQWA